MRNYGYFALQAEFEDICEEAELWTKLHDLEQLCQEQGLLDGQDAAVRSVAAILHLVHACDSA